MYKPFRFGIIIEDVQTREELIGRARRAEALGYDTLLVPDHFSTLAPISTLMALADATTTIRIGSHVFGNDFRSPAMLAREVAALDQLSGGRFQLGLGCGYLQADYQQAGIPLEEPKVRVDRFQEALFIIKHYFTDEEVNFSGKYYSVTGLKGSTIHVQKPHPPIYIGGGGNGKRMLKIAGREADIVGVSIGTTESVKERLSWLRDAAQERFEQLELATMVFSVVVTDQREAVAQRIASSQQSGPERRSFSLTPEQVLDSLQFLIGSEDQIVETLLNRRERLGYSFIQVAGKYLEAFAPIVARLAGT
jgi:probable F420-dependent oxidoreductase